MHSPRQRYVHSTKPPVFQDWSRTGKDFMRGEPFLDRDPMARIGPVYAPAFDLFETTEQYTLLGDLPGLALGDLDLELTGDSLTITGERDGDDAVQEADCHALERTFGSFVRRFEFRERVDAGRSLARMVNGVLLVEVPKRREASPGR